MVDQSCDHFSQFHLVFRLNQSPWPQQLLRPYEWYNQNWKDKYLNLNLKTKKIGFVDIGHFYKKIVIQGILQTHNIIQGFITIEGIKKYIL